MLTGCTSRDYDYSDAPLGLLQRRHELQLRRWWFCAVFTVQLLDAQSPTPLEGVEVCAAENPDVERATSDVDGNVVLTLPSGDPAAQSTMKSFAPVFVDERCGSASSATW